MTDHILLPVLEEFKKRLDKIETELKKSKSEKKPELNMQEIQEYLQSIDMT